MGFKLSNVVKVAGIVAAPFTGGASLALTGAAAAHDERVQAQKQQAEEFDRELAAQKAAVAENAKNQNTAQQKTIANSVADLFTPSNFSAGASSLESGIPSQATCAVCKNPAVWIIGVIAVIFFLRKL